MVTIITEGAGKMTELREDEGQEEQGTKTVGIKSTETKRGWNGKGKGKQEGKKGGRERDRVC